VRLRERRELRAARERASGDACTRTFTTSMIVQQCDEISIYAQTTSECGSAVDGDVV
jgi:hypothetical protein